MASSTLVPTAPDAATHPAAYLRSIYSVRERSQRVMRKAQHNDLNHFDVDMSKLDDVAAYVTQIIKRDYAPRYETIPPHGRWQHFEVGGVPRITRLLERWTCDVRESTRRLLDLFLVSVLLDAGAGNSWVYTAADGERYNRSEGLAVASLEMFEKGLFSSDASINCRVDGKALRGLTVEDVGQGLQVGQGNRMDGLEGRAQVLVRLGTALENEKFFGSPGRPGCMLDYLLNHPTTHNRENAPIVSLPTFWDCLMDGLTPIWPASRTKIDGRTLGDAWPLVALGASIKTNSASLTRESDPDTIIPFHKLTQWLCYSLMTPMTRLLGIQFAGADLMTGLAEYRNGGLLVDLGLLSLKSADAERGLQSAKTEAHSSQETEQVPLFEADDDVIVEWRGLIVGFLDLLLPLVNEQLGLADSANKTALSLAQMLEAGTWKGGREIAAKKRPKTKGPPIAVRSDGTVF